MLYLDAMRRTGLLLILQETLRNTLLARVIWTHRERRVLLVFVRRAQRAEGLDTGYRIAFITRRGEIKGTTKLQLA